MHFFWLLLLLLAGIAGWLLRGKFIPHVPKKNQPGLSKDYFVGLNYLLNEQPDEAVDVFIRLLEIDSHTVEVHMALGSLFRRRGEINRAIRIHQNIIARPNLPKELRVQALQELGRDYMAAGVFDRAERLFLETVESDTRYRLQSLHYLIDIYEREKDWFSALEIAQQLDKQTKVNKGQAIAHYYCEIIEDPRNQLSSEQTNKYLQLALQVDKHCLRAGLLKAKQAAQVNDTKNAIKLYQRLVKQDATFIPKIMPLLENLYQQTNDHKGLIDYLYKQIGVEQSPQPLLIVTLAKKLQVWHGTAVAIDFLTKQLPEHVSLSGLEYLLTLHTELSSEQEQQNIDLLLSVVHRLAVEKARYLCEHCGFSGQQLHWLCPSCRRWGTIKPLTA